MAGKAPLRPQGALAVKVQLVEDSSVVRERLASLLAESKGIEVVGQAARAAEAIEAFQQLRPQVVILDLQLAEGTGFDVLKNLKQQRPAPLILVLTNYAYPQYRQKCLELGADFFFDKATEFDQVLKVVRQLLPAEG